MKKLLTTASVLVGLTISFNLLANSDIHLDHADTNILIITRGSQEPETLNWIN
jgi:hypothetical protein